MYKLKHLLSAQDLSREDIYDFIDLAREFKALNRSDVKKSDSLRGKTVINAFFENSTRTRTSFEIAAKRLGADSVNFTAADSSTKKGETLIDTIRNMQAMRTDIFVLRHSCSGAAKFGVRVGDKLIQVGQKVVSSRKEALGLLAKGGGQNLLFRRNGFDFFYNAQ